ncbi:unnamed protein product [Cuscuta europaea]|uniref:Uncharacterized protein n=1 Tax=Cuscuta europaea TaxID=41803 RepID=A0A9P1EA53_CUSEU|nr:unnamed protein product [Cuscuta europaea]
MKTTKQVVLHPSAKLHNTRNHLCYTIGHITVGHTYKSSANPHCHLAAREALVDPFGKTVEQPGSKGIATTLAGMTPRTITGQTPDAPTIHGTSLSPGTNFGEGNLLVHFF